MTEAEPVVWALEYLPAAQKWLGKADPQIARRVHDALRSFVALENPRTRGKALTGTTAGLWAYRVGDYRVICEFVDGRVVVLVIDIDHRSSVYKAT